MQKEVTSDGKKPFVSLPNIYKAYKKLKPIIKRTPLTYSHFLSVKYDCNIYLKREDLQLVRSFKLRGAYNAISSLDPELASNGIVCASAGKNIVIFIGNHAQGVAWSCKKLKIQGTIFMPENAPKIKLNAVRSFGGEFIEVQQFGNTFDECFRKAKQFCEEQEKTFIHPYDDEKATCAVEIFEEFQEDVDFIICPVGGGGFCAGLVSYAHQVSPTTQIIGCEAAGCPSMKICLEKDEWSALPSINPFVDGVAVGIPGRKPFAILREVMKTVLLSGEGEVCKAILDLYEHMGILVEPAGALSVATLEKVKDQIKGKNVICILSGSNNDIGRMQDIKNLSETSSGHLFYLLVNFFQKPGSIRKFFLECLTEQDSIPQMSQVKQGNKERGPTLVGLECENLEAFQTIEGKLKDLGIGYKWLQPGTELYNLLV